MTQRSSMISLVRRHRFLVGILAALFVALVYYDFPGSFDPTIWRAHHGDTTPGNPRWSMRHDLRWRYLSYRMKHAEVIALLGEPDRFKDPSEFSYNLGMHSGFGIDEDCLDLFFDRAGYLIRSRVCQN